MIVTATGRECRRVAGPWIGIRGAIVLPSLLREVAWRPLRLGLGPLAARGDPADVTVHVLRVSAEGRTRHVLPPAAGDRRS